MARSRKRASRPSATDPLWYQDAVIYELHIRAFADSDGDGIGDFRGLTSKLDYLEQLGVTAIWLLPFYPSPLRDDGYDIASYLEIHPSYGTLKDFQAFLDAAHDRGLAVITELVMNHTSDQHAWFQRARRAAPGSKHRDYYVWSDDPDGYADARIIFKDFEHSNWTYDAVAKAYFWHRFYSHQPDLNFENPAVQREMLRIVDFWFQMGVDGLRLDAVPYLYEREGTDCENLPETHAFLKTLRKHVDQKFPNRMLLAEANQWPEDAAQYFGEGDECHMNFHFPLMPRLFMALKMEDRFPILDILRQTPELPPGCQWALFLRNHDELTLEMVTDEERDYMYRVYAYDRQARINLGIRRRLAPLLGKNRRAIELMNALLLSMPGTPVIYYGDELGMGDNIFLGDRNGVRTPMQWSYDRNAGFSSATPQSLYLPVIIEPEYHFESINVEAQSNNPNSLLWWMRGAITLRKRHPSMGRGTISLREPANRKVLVYLRRHEDDLVLVVANLSRFAQFIELELPELAGRRPVEIFGRVEFPTLGPEPYRLTLGPHAFHWFHLREPAGIQVQERGTTEILSVPDHWTAVALGSGRKQLEDLLVEFLPTKRWFAGKARDIAAVEVSEGVELREGGQVYWIALINVTYDEGDPETYQLPLAFAAGSDAEHVWEATPQGVVARLQVTGEGREPLEGVLFDAAYEPGFRAALLDLIRRRRSLPATRGVLRGLRTRGRAAAFKDGLPGGESRVVSVEQSNTSLIYDQDFILKLYRRIEDGINPDFEVGTFLTVTRRFPATPDVYGWLQLERPRGAVASLGTLHQFVPNEGDAWAYTLDEVERFLELAAAHATPPDPEWIPAGGALATLGLEPPLAVLETTGGFLETAQLLGRRIAEMHVALASSDLEPDFQPERFTPMARRALYQSLRNLTKRSFEVLRQRLDRLPSPIRPEARHLLEHEDDLLEHARRTLDKRLSSFRTRIHGDLHLGQVLWTGRDFMIIDFEGEPSLPLGERRLKRSPLRDVAGMLRSFHYASTVALEERIARRIAVAAEDQDPLRRWTRVWRIWIGGSLLHGYLDTARRAVFLADAGDAEVAALLHVHRLEKCIYELLYELNSRPHYVRIPLAGIRQILEETTD